jgi:hypothetical protein
LNIRGWCDTCADDFKLIEVARREVSNLKLCLSPWGRRMILI